MKKFRLLQRFLMVLFVVAIGSQMAVGQLLPYKNPALSFDERAKDLLSRMTVEEKISQMMNVSPAVERLGIQQYDWWNEALHGVARAGAATVFPQAIALAATFDDQAVHETFTIVSDEARAKHHDAVKRGDFRRYTGLTFWTPNINIFRDPRWGRGMETYGEDPYLTGRMGVAVVKGLQGDGTSKYDKAHACAKHYAVHSGPEWNRHSYDAKNISNRDMLETYLPAFQELVQEADVKEVMCAYNRLEGEPCCGSSNLLISILRDKWGFDGVVTSDCGAISDFWVKGRHETSPDKASASATAVISGTDVECGNNFKALSEAYAAGQINEAQIDQAVFRLLKARFELGMFDDPSLVSWSNIPMSVVESAPHKAKALEMARKTMVLLSNKNNALPLSKNLKKVAVMGPNASDSVMLWANYNGIPTKSVTILEGITKKLPSTNVVFEKGCDLVSDKVFNSLFKDCTADNKSGFKATYFNGRTMQGTPLTTVMIPNPFNFNTSGSTVFAPGVPLNEFSAKFEATFKPSQSAEVVFRIGGDDGYRLLIDGEEKTADWGDHGLTRKEYILKAEAGKSYEVEVHYYNGGTGGILNFDMGIVSNVDYDAIALKVSDADVIIFAGGISSKLEGEEMRVDFPGFRGGDRTDIELPAVQRNLLKALKATGKPVIFVLCAGSAMAVNQENEALDAILLAWYPGQEGGTAVADVLFGDYNPAGRLPVTFYKSVNQIPDFEDYNMNLGRTYRYMKEKPLYPFGYGLSYTTFAYENAKTGRTTLKAGDPLYLEIMVKNTGKMDGDEVVQLYVRNLQDPNGPVKSLRAFKRIHIPSGKSATVKLALPAKSFEFYDEASSGLKIKPGNYELLYGGSSDSKDLKSLMITLN